MNKRNQPNAENKAHETAFIEKLANKQKQLEQNMARTVILIQDVVDSIRAEDVDNGKVVGMNVVTDDMFNATFTEVIHNTHTSLCNRNTVAQVEVINNNTHTANGMDAANANHHQ